MGFFNSISNAFKKSVTFVKRNIVKPAANTISHVGKTIGQGARNIIHSNEFKSVVSTAKNAVSTVYKDAKAVVTAPITLTNKLVDKGSTLIKKGEDTILGISKNLAIPLIAVAGVGLLIVLKK